MRELNERTECRPKGPAVHPARVEGPGKNATHDDGRPNGPAVLFRRAGRNCRPFGPKKSEGEPSSRAFDPWLDERLARWAVLISTQTGRSPLFEAQRGDLR